MTTLKVEVQSGTQYLIASSEHQGMRRNSVNSEGFKISRKRTGKCARQIKMAAAIVWHNWL